MDTHEGIDAHDTYDDSSELPILLDSGDDPYLSRDSFMSATRSTGSTSTQTFYAEKPQSLLEFQVKSQVYSAETAKHWFKSSSDDLGFALLVGDKVVRSWKLCSAEWQSEKSLYKSRKSLYKVITVRVPFECKFINQEVTPHSFLIVYRSACVCARSK